MQSPLLRQYHAATDKYTCSQVTSSLFAKTSGRSRYFSTLSTSTGKGQTSTGKPGFLLHVQYSTKHDLLLELDISARMPSVAGPCVIAARLLLDRALPLVAVSAPPQPPRLVTTQTAPRGRCDTVPAPLIGLLQHLQNRNTDQH